MQLQTSVESSVWYTCKLSESTELTVYQARSDVAQISSMAKTSFGGRQD